MNFCDSTEDGEADSLPPGTCLLSYDPQPISSRIAGLILEGDAVPWSGGLRNSTGAGAIPVLPGDWGWERGLLLDGPLQRCLR